MNKLWKAADLSLWQGRSDAGEIGDTRRLFNIVQPFSDNPLEKNAKVLLGFASDAGVLRNKGRVGAALAPKVLRTMLANLPAHELETLYDAGDIVCEADGLEEAQEALATAINSILAQGGLPIILGGGHEVAWGSWQGFRRYLDTVEDKGEVLILNLDAHFDLRSTKPANSGTPFYQILEASKALHIPFHYACLGVSKLSNTAALFASAIKEGVFYLEDNKMQESQLPAILEKLEELLAKVSHVYLTVDLDVLPASTMPAVSAPAAYGVPLSVIEAIICKVRDSGKLGLADFAELNPNFDRDNQGARVAARLVYQLLD